MMTIDVRHRSWRCFRVVALALVATLVAACASDDPAGDDTAASEVISPTTAARETSTDDSATEPAGALPTASTSESTDEQTGDSSAAVPSTAANDTSVDTSTRVTLPDDSGLEPVAGGTMRFGLIADVDGLNPTSSALTATSGVIMANAVFDTLAAYGESGTAVPYLAESFTPSDDFLSWDVRLRPGIQFHDGTPLDAVAVQLNF